VLQDYTEAVKWFRKAADQRYPWGQFNLGIMYLQGHGVPQDYAEAEKWYREAANVGHAGAWFGLGTMYLNGNGVPQDYAIAYMWFNLAAAHNYPNASNYRDYTAQKMTTAQIAEAQKLSRDWKPSRCSFWYPTTGECGGTRSVGFW
jgi:TPR repeat protein